MMVVMMVFQLAFTAVLLGLVYAPEEVCTYADASKAVMLQ